jgi:uncharacterized DUF497 family protein
MMFEWDEGKAEANLKKHGVSFAEAQTVFADPLYVDFYDPDHSSEEHRYIIIGRSERGRLLLVSYAQGGSGALRLISLTPAERKAYEED